MNPASEPILIVGGAGYIGSHINKGLSGQGYRTVVFDNFSCGHREFLKWGEFVEGDLADVGQIRGLFAQYRFAAVMHFSAFTYVGESVSDPAKYYANNVTNTLNLLNVMRENTVNKFIFSSSAATYGDPVETPITETHPLAPINPYGRTKLMVENILADYSSAYDVRYTALRYFNAAGADPETEVGEWHDPETHLIPLVLDAALGTRKNIQIYGTDYDTPDGTCVRDYIHVADLADAHIRALERLLRGEGSAVFNLGNGKGFSVREVIDIAGKVTGRNIPVIETDRRPGDPAVLIADAKKAESVLGWRPRYPGLDAIIESAWKWHRKLFGEKAED
ncbi:MAG: UDP-glucose 4-epimerase GalE [Spirochaetes bacterium]|nr:UDP-glucose 4-epimerase GalE [Spirochaetota bacterium]